MGKNWYIVVVVLLPVLLALLSLYALDVYMMCGHDIIADVVCIMSLLFINEW